MNLVLLTKVMSLSGKIRLKIPSRSGGYYTHQERRREEVLYSKTHFDFILFCFAFATTNDMREDLFWEWVRQAHCFSSEEKDGILALRNSENESSRSIGFLTLTRRLDLRSIILRALERSGANNVGQFLNYSLEWGRTSQGHDFWMNLNRKFNNCWTCITRAVMRPTSPNLGIDELRAAIRTNISARLLAPTEMNPFFSTYEEDLRQYEERRLRREQEWAHQLDLELRRVSEARSSEGRVEAVETEGHVDEPGDNGQDGTAYIGQNGEVHFITQEEYERMRSAMETNHARAEHPYDTLPDGSIIVRFSDGTAMRYMAHHTPTGVVTQATEITEQPVTGDGLLGQISPQGTTAANTATSVSGRGSTNGQIRSSFHFSYVDPFADLM